MLDSFSKATLTFLLKLAIPRATRSKLPHMITMIGLFASLAVVTQLTCREVEMRWWENCLVGRILPEIRTQIA